MSTLVYHGAACAVPHPLAGYGRADLDFGQGFYVTTLSGQAERWANIVAMRIPQGKAILNIYELDTEQICQQYRCLTFEAYDLAWLNFIVRSRQGDKPWLGYDFIEGGVANDRVIDTVESYIAGTMPADLALERLAQHRPNQQICLLNQRLIDQCLHFKESVTLPQAGNPAQKGGIPC